MAFQLECRVTVAAPPERVFAALTDPDRIARWMPGFVRFDRLTEGPVRVGTRLREVRRMFGREAAEVFEFTELDPPRAFSLYVDGKLGSSKKGEYRLRYTLRPQNLEPGGGGTEVLFAGEVSGMGKVAEFFGRLLQGFVKKAFTKDLVAMKAFVEKGEAP